MEPNRAARSEKVDKMENSAPVQIIKTEVNQDCMQIWNHLCISRLTGGIQSLHY